MHGNGGVSRMDDTTTDFGVSTVPGDFNTFGLTLGSSLIRACVMFFDKV
jgi:hypothetical protein